MKNKKKNFLEALVILITLFVFFSFLSNTSNLKAGEPADFYAISKEISLNELHEKADKNNISLYLPSELPNNLELVTIYFKESSFIAIIVYSAEGNKDYKTAELTIQISISNSPPTYDDLLSQVENSPNETALEINNWPVLINEKAYVGNIEETRSKYGDYILLLTVWIENMRYMKCCPTFNTNTALQIVESMRLAV